MMRHKKLVALFLFLVLMTFPIFTIMAQEATTEPEATAESTETASEDSSTTDDGATYVVQVGDNLFRIALRNGLTTRQLAEANGITNPALIFVGQRLIIPSGATTPPPVAEATAEAPSETEEPTAEAPSETEEPTAEPTQVPSDDSSSNDGSSNYVVQRGDTLFRIAVRNQSTVSELLRLNPAIVNQNLIFVGQRISLPDGSSITTDNTSTTDTTTPEPTEVAITLDLTPNVGVEVFLGDDSDIAAQVAELGVNTVKFIVDWREVEPTEGNFQFAAIDEAVQNFDAAGANIILTLIGSPDWAIASATELALAQGASIPPDDLNDFGTFAGVVAERYAGVVDAYEIWSDPNLRINWMIPNVELRSDGFPDARLAIEVRYIDLLEAAYKAIKEADSDTMVITAGLAPTGNDDFYNSIDTFVFFEALMKQGALNFSDAVGIHIDGFSNAPDAECCGTVEDGIAFNENYHFFFNVMLANYREILDRNGGEDVALYVTRVGWGTAENAIGSPRADVSYLSENTASEQAQFIADAFEIAASRGDIATMVVYNLNGCTVNSPQACYYSVFDANGDARPVFDAIQAIDFESANGGDSSGG
ncbi:MAG: LysM peptidoglycan-binding domain-containing protein [Anaerolineae bacterium]|nr:LysM peptidoglycan-binding domain-containing protein [Anaerolineae bacterium]MDQ7034394.1 LysM peptidoglycan-binding domain-containing protein [Anaerolineae bacterium]